MSQRLTGLAAAPGTALAPAWWVTAAPTPSPADEPAGPAEPDVERARLDAALERAAAELHELADKVAGDAGADEAAIFQAHAAFAADPALLDAAAAELREGASAEQAARRAFDQFRDALAALSSEYLAARAADLDDVRDRVLRKLAGGDDPATQGPTGPVVVVADELSPSQTAELDTSLVHAVVTRKGSPTSHAAILARALAIPAVVGVGELDEVDDGALVGVDGDQGTVVVDPPEAEASRLRRRADARQAQRADLAELRHEPGRTADGTPVELAANVGATADLDPAVSAGAEGVGLLRTEFLYLDRTEPPSVDEQQATYEQALSRFPGGRVVFRTLDAGADKPLPFTSLAEEPNPALGMRGIRLSLRTPEIFADQLRALLRAARTRADGARAAVMVPMVSVPSELDRARQILEQVADDEGADLDLVELGAMIEVPSAALRAEVLARRCDFLSIGTNDLLQYLFAADRLVAEVADLAALLDPVALGVIRDVVAGGHSAGCWVGVCGEAAAMPELAAVLVGLGVDELSMTPAAIPVVKDLLRHHDLAALRGAAEAALAAADADGARTEVDDALARDRADHPASSSS